MLNENFVYLGFLLIIFGNIHYLIDTVRGKIKPNRVSNFFWGLAPMIAFLAEINQGVKVQAFFTFLVGFFPIAIFIATFFNKNSVWKLTIFDLSCGVLAFIGIILWQTTKIGDLAIIFSILADFFAAIPTLTKSFKYPETESYPAYLAGSSAALITLLT